MLSQETSQFLEKPLIARLSTIGEDGYPHTVPLWFMLDGEDIVIISLTENRKVKNALQNPKASVTIGGTPGDEAGYLLQGDLIVAPDIDHTWTKRITYHYESKEAADKNLAEWTQKDLVTLRLKIAKVIKVY